MALKLSDFNRGADAIKEAAKSGGSRGGFAPQIKWEVGEEKYVKFLLDIDETPSVRIHEWVELGQRENGKPNFGFYLDRTDPVIGEDSDPLTDKGSQPTKRILSAAVEVEAVIGDNGKGRKRPTGFTVATSTYDRKTDDGTEEVTQPVVGYVAQASSNFFSQLVASDESGEYEGTVFKVKRVDDKTYQFTPYLDLDVDYSALREHIEGVSYLARDEETWDELEPLLANTDDDVEYAHAVGVALLERRLNELADWDKYKAETSGIEEITPKYPKGNDKKGGAKRERPARQSQRASSESRAKPDAETSKAKFNRIKEMAAAQSGE